MPKTSNYAYGAYSPELYSVVRETLHRLGDLDYHYAAELGQVETSLSDEEIKSTSTSGSWRTIKSCASLTSIS